MLIVDTLNHTYYAYIFGKIHNINLVETFTYIVVSLISDGVDTPMYAVINKWKCDLMNVRVTKQEES